MNIMITGGSKGIGLAIAKTIALQKDQKHAMGICGRNEAELQKADLELRSITPLHEFLVMKCDVSIEDDVTSFVEKFEEKFGAIDVLVNNAGFGIFKPVLETTKQDFESVLGANLRGVFLLSRAVLPKMRLKKSGTIITISSLAGKNGFAGATAYCASKFAVRGFMQCLFLEVRTDNIRCVTICPGSVDTDFFTTDSSISAMKSKKALSAQDVADAVELTIRMPQNADISEIDLRPTNPKG